MAVADDLMQLPVAQVEEPLCLTISVVLQAQPTEKRVLERNSDWRAGAARSVPRFRIHVFGAWKRSKASPGVSVQKVRPTFDALGSGHYWVCRQGFNFRDGMQLVECLMFHGRLLSTGEIAHAFRRIIAPRRADKTAPTRD
jgi:hypothetical protein